MKMKSNIVLLPLTTHQAKKGIHHPKKKQTIDDWVHNESNGCVVNFPPSSRYHRYRWFMGAFLFIIFVCFSNHSHWHDQHEMDTWININNIMVSFIKTNFHWQLVNEWHKCNNIPSMLDIMRRLYDIEAKMDDEQSIWYDDYEWWVMSGWNIRWVLISLWYFILPFFCPQNYYWIVEHFDENGQKE